MRDTKHLRKHANKLAESAKEKALFRAQRKAIEAGARLDLKLQVHRKLKELIK